MKNIISLVIMTMVWFCAHSAKTYMGIPMGIPKKDFVSHLKEQGFKSSDGEGYIGVINGNIDVYVTFKVDSKQLIKQVTETFMEEDKSKAMSRMKGLINTVKHMNEDYTDISNEDKFMYILDGGNSCVSISVDQEDGIYYLFYTTYNGLPTEESIDISEPSGSILGHNYVDLGLSVMWATANIGASTDYDFGDYFMWAGTKLQECYDCHHNDNLALNKKNIIGSEYDAAASKWGYAWRLPNIIELRELIEECSWSWIEKEGKNGYAVTGPNGNTIFLPAAGYRRNYDIKDKNKIGYYRSGINDGNDYLLIESGLHYLSGVYRDNDGLSVRPIFDPKSLPKATGNINGHEYVDLGLSVKWAMCNVGVNDFTKTGDLFRWGNIESSAYPWPDTEEYKKHKLKETKKISLISGDTMHDVATNEWGDSWRMPNEKEVYELINKCTWTKIQIGGVEGYKVIGPNGNWIFLPLTNWNQDIGSSKIYYGKYWTGESYSDHKRANALYLTSKSVYLGGEEKVMPCPIRPVAK